MSQDLETEDGQLQTLSLLEQLQATATELWSSSSKLHERVDGLLRQLADPRLPDIATNLPFRIEMWDRWNDRMRWVISASTSVAVAGAAFDAAVVIYPNERLTLRQGARVIRKHEPGSSE